MLHNEAQSKMLWLQACPLLSCKTAECLSLQGPFGALFLVFYPFASQARTSFRLSRSSPPMGTFRKEAIEIQTPLMTDKHLHRDRSVACPHLPVTQPDSFPLLPFSFL